MAELTESQKRFLIKSWACDLEYKEIVDRFVEHFQQEGETIERPTSSQCARYNLEFDSGAAMSKEHQSLFRSYRKKFREEVDAIPGWHQSYRLRELQTLYLRQKKKSDVIAADLLKQMAQERGKIFERPEPAASPAEIDAYVANMATQFRSAIDKHVTDEGVRKSVLDEIESVVEAAG